MQLPPFQEFHPITTILKFSYLHDRYNMMRLSSNLWLFVFLPVLSGLLLWLSWPPLPSSFLIFIGFIPLLISEKLISEKFKRATGIKAWLSLYIGLLIWNLATTWWVSIASVAGGLFANLANPLLMTVPFMCARFMRRHFGNRIGYTSLIFFWMSFEFIHLQWEFTWPWLSLGNVFAYHHTWIQWYEYTGVFGGTMWVWVINLLVFHLFYFQLFPQEKKTSEIKSPFKKYLPHLCTVLLIAVPILISKNIYDRTIEQGTPVNVTVVQPNIDPYQEKFKIPYRQQIDKMIGLSREGLTDSTDFLAWPETSIPDPGMKLDNLLFERPIRKVKTFTDQYPDLTAIIGINGRLIYDDHHDATNSSTEIVMKGGMDTLWVDEFNTAIKIDSSKKIDYYNKSKLVPGAERMPYPGVFKFLGKFAIELGGTAGLYGTQKERTVFFSKDSIGVAPVICYESVFGEYVTDYVHNGASLIFIITNDGWWGDTDGYKQHCLYAKLRSIETRRSIARSANTGISCFINQHGDISQATTWQVDAVINETIYANTAATFYVNHGDYIARAALWVSILLLVLGFIKSRLNKKQDEF